ncbi:carboxypeptidase-like regulatory domain-containing protein, partial [Longimicrobium sp.]|uniref:TonB-dependent receptor n=1 Tax=Longimicrobium sp. TaxID=2029185 RepID=UPI002E31A190
MKPGFIVRAIVLLLCMIGASPGAAGAQTTTGRLQGYVRGADGEEMAGATVVARNTETNQRRQVVTAQNGAYVLAGLRPGPYELTVTRVGGGAQSRAVQLGVGQSLDVNFTIAPQAVQLEAVSVSATGSVAETRTSEVATNVTRQQVESLPTADRNFLGLAVLAPGTQLQGTTLDATRRTFSAGAQNAEQVNVFIDGASYKNDILAGGVAGQDASRGNPFPRNAIGEFRVITQNFKAEYQKASSAIITATTRSGTNQWEVNGFVNYQDAGLVALDSFQRADRRANPAFERPDFERYQWGVDVGGPIIRDRLFFFGSVERNDQTRASRVNIVPPTGFPALDSINFAQYNGEFDQPFRSILGFAKLGWEHREGSFFELSFNTRHENDIRDFGGLTAFESATRFRNDVNTGILKHTWTRGDLLNEVTLSGQRYHYNPQPNSPGTVNRFFGFGCCAQLGSNISEQDFTQTRWAIRNDLTWTGLQMAGDHV